MRYNCLAQHVAGTYTVKAHIADVSDISDEVKIYVGHVKNSWPATNAKLKEIAIETMKDPELYIAGKYGWPIYHGCLERPT